jgi:DNA repair protein RAD5
MPLQILADAMGLGKTVMGISLLVSSPGRGGLHTLGSLTPQTEDISEKTLNQDLTVQLEETTQTKALGSSLHGKNKLGSIDSTGKQRGGGTLIVCPMTLLGQWKVIILILGCTTLITPLCPFASTD